MVELLSAERLDSVDVRRLRLPADLREIFERREKAAGRHLKGMRSSQLMAYLIAIDEAPWRSYYGGVLEARDLASLLRHYGIKPKSIRLGKGKGKEVAKGYKRDDPADVWNRYLPTVTP